MAGELADTLSTYALRLLRVGEKAEAEDVVEGRRVFARGLDRANATAMAQRIEDETMSVVGIIDEAESHRAERELDLVLRTSERAPWLEQAIREADEPNEAMAVHADWLQRQGDPRGIVAALDLARAHAASPEERERLDRAFADALVEHHPRLFGPLSAVQDCVELTWQGGLVTGLELGRDDKQELPPGAMIELFERLLALPICACLRSMDVDSPSALGGIYVTALQTCEPSTLAGLRRLRVASYHELACIDWSRLPRLELLSISTPPSTPINLPSLRELIILAWEPEDVVPVLRASELPSLRVLRLAPTFAFDEPRAILADTQLTSMLAALVDLPFVASLEILEIQADGPSDAWSRKATEILLEAPALRNIAEIDLRHVWFDRESRALLADQPNFRLR